MHVHVYGNGRDSASGVVGSATSMASKFRCRHEFDCSEDTFWDVCTFSEEFSKKLYMDVLKFPGWKQLEQTDDGTTLSRRIQIDPPLVGVPAPVLKIVGDKFSYMEIGKFDRKSHRYTFEIKPSTAADKAKTSGVLWTEKLGDKKCARFAEVDVDVKVFLVGSLLEEKILSDLKKSYEETSRYIGEYLKEKGLS